KPRLVLLEKALRLAQRHARHSNKPRLLCFLLGSVCVDADEGGVTVTLDRFDPGRDQTGSSIVPSPLLPGDVLVPCWFSTQNETVVQSEAELHRCFKVCLSVCMPLCLSVSLSVSLSACFCVCVCRFLTMDQTRKLLLLLESDPKASNLPLVGLWLSGVRHISNPQVWAWCVRFLYSSALQDRVLSESRCFLLVLFASTHRAPQFFQCRGPGPGPGPAPQLDYQLLTASQCVTLYQQVVSVEGRTLRCELGSEDHSRQTEVFREAQTSFNRAAPPTARLSASDQDSGVEDEDLSPRPTPSPHPPAQQARRVQPSVPELSLLIDSSFISNQNARQGPGSAHRDPAVPPTRNTTTSSSAPRPAAPPHLHSTPNSNLQEPCSCCSTHTYDCTSIFSSSGLHPLPPSLHPAPPTTPSVPPSSILATPLSSRHHTPSPFCTHPPHSSRPPPSHLLPPPPCTCSHPPPAPCCDQVGGVVPSETYQLLLHQDRQLRLLQAQVQMLLEAQGRLQSSGGQVEAQTPRSTASIAVGTGASLFWGNPVQSSLPHQKVQAPPTSSSSHADLSVIGSVGGDEDSEAACSSSSRHRCSVSGLESPVLGESVSMYRPDGEQLSFYRTLKVKTTSHNANRSHDAN
ncbi:SCL-interrupting locus protein homolog, partial [Anarrhichthys ocellatus]|uniref:SCL-interrupting locus protein homolog n=1 Tax=Anarrhichthys ocellatus TaxID=433405 RepID=UPI0012EE1707